MLQIPPMPVTHELQDGTIALRMVGEYEPADVRAALSGALESSGAEDLRGILFDVSRSTVLRRRDTRAIRAMAGFLAHVALQRQLRVALVGTGDLAYGLMRLGAADLDSAGVTASVFRDEADARRWLSGP